MLKIKVKKEFLKKEIYIKKVLHNWGWQNGGYFGDFYNNIKLCRKCSKNVKE